MDIFSLIVLLGGLAFFLYGMHNLSSSLEKLAGGKLQGILQRITSHPVKGLLLGAVVTAAIQSSSAVTVMLVGLVNSGIMQFGQTISILMGSNIGTTMTAWIISLTGIEGDNVLMRLLKPENFTLVFALISIIFIMSSKKERKRDVGGILISFAILMYGMKLMSDAVSPLADMPEFTSILTAFNNPILGVAFGAVFTAIIQSSSASVGVLQALSLTGQISYGMAIPIIMGQNIGTCITAIISSVGVTKSARRVAVVHVIFNVLGTIVCLTAFYILNAVFQFAFVKTAIHPVGIAFVHTVFNLITTALLFPFLKKLEKLAYVFIKEEQHAEDKNSFLDERLLNQPSFAIYESNVIIRKMAENTKNIIFDAIHLFQKFDPAKAQSIIDGENELDRYEDELGSYLVKLSGKDLSDADNMQVSKYLHVIGDFERIGDHAVNIMKSAQEIHDKNASFSEDARHELHALTSALLDILDMTILSFQNNDILTAKRIEPFEQVIDDIIADIRSNHIRRLQEGRCTIELGFILNDLLTNFERVSDHCSNIAVAMIESDIQNFEGHKYLSEMKHAGMDNFEENYKSFSEKYHL
jgi:phosphate:Na+ symporter